MPRHLPHALAQFVELTAEIELDEATVEAAHAPLIAYACAWCDWAELGIDVPAESRRQVRAMWSERPALRGFLSYLVSYYPCDEFEGPFSKIVERGGSPDFIAWFRRYPRLRESLRPAVISHTRKFNQWGVVLGAGLKWARYFDGGDEAYRAIALALNRHDRVWKKTRSRFEHEDFVRHDLNQHGTISLEEGRAINRHLAALDGELLDLDFIGCLGPWKSKPPEWWREPMQLGSGFVTAAEAAHGFAGERWSAADVAIYGKALHALPAAVREAIPAAAEDSVLAEIERYALSCDVMAG